MKKTLSIFFLLFIFFSIWGESGYFTLEENGNTYMAFNVSIIGEVSRNGNFIIKDGQRLSDLISLAGGFTNNANINNIIIVRGDTVLHCNFKKYLKTAEKKYNPELQPNDYIVIKRSFWSYFLDGIDVLYKTALTANVIAIIYAYITK